MKSADIITIASDLYEVAAGYLVAQGGERFADHAQVVSSDGYLFNLFADGDDEWRSDSYVVASDRALPDLSLATGCYVECRSEAFFSRVVRAIGKSLSDDLWVLDGNYVAWHSDGIDLEHLLL